MALSDGGGALAVEVTTSHGRGSTATLEVANNKRKSVSLGQSFLQDFAAGGLASVLSKTAMAPIERCCA